MAYKCFFMSDETYSASDVNQMFARLTSRGVSLFDVSGNGTLIDINTAVSNFAGAGVELYNPDACKVVRVSDTQIKIMPGTAIMNDGSMIVFDEDGYTFEAVFRTCVVLRRNMATNTIDVLSVGEDEVQADDVCLANIDNNTVRITDTRSFSTTKLAPSTANILVSKTISIPSIFGGYSYSYDMGWGGFQWIKCPQDDETVIYDLSEGDAIIKSGSLAWYVSKNVNNLVFTAPSTTDLPSKTVTIEVR